MINKWRAWINRPIMWALLFWLLDLLWCIGIFTLGWIGNVIWREDEFVSAVKWMESISPISRSWGFVHSPISRIIDPILIPVVTFDPLYPSIWMFYLRDAICLLQSAFIGYVIGWLVRLVLRWKQKSLS